METPVKQQHFSFLSGGGEMGELIRRYDWSVTSLGPIENWSPCLRTAVGLMLTSKFPMLIFWGKDLTTFYNDAFRPSLGSDGKHPSSLGQPGEESWAESWSTIGPMIYNIMAGGEPVWFEDQKLPIYREGKLDYAYWTYSFSPIRDDDETIAGLLVTCSETTKAVESIQQLAETREQQEMAIEAAELGTWDYNPATGNFSANTRLKQWFGLQPDDEIALSLALDVIDEADRQRVAATIAAVMQPGSAGRYDEQYTIVAGPEHQPRIVAAKGQTTFNDAGQAIRLNGTLRDVTEQVVGQQRVEEERKRLLSLFQQSQVAVAIISRENLVFQMANPFYGELVDRKPEEIVGKPLLDALPEIAGQGFDALLNNVLQTGEPFVAPSVPVNVRRGDDLQTIYVDLAYQPLRGNNDGSISDVVVIATDVTQSVLARQTIEASETKFRSLIQEAPFATALYVGTDLVVDLANEPMIQLWGKTPAVLGKKLIEAVPELEGQPFIGLLQEVMNTGVAYSTREQSADLVVNGRLQRFWFNFTYKPVLDSHGKVYGILNMAVDVSEQVEARKQLEESNLFARSIIDNSPVAKAVYLGEDMTVTIVNQNMLEIMGRDRSIVGKPFLQALPELEPTPIMDRLLQVYRTGESFYQPEEKILIIRHGQPHIGYYNYTYKALRNTAGEIYGVVNTATEITQQVVARKKLEEAETKLLAAIDVAELATWSVDAITKEITYSPRLQEWLGLEKSKLATDGSLNIVESDRVRVRQAVEGALAPGGPGELDEVYTIVNNKTGKKRIIHTNGRTFFDIEGNPLVLSGTAQDVTMQQESRLALENEVQVRTEELAAAVEELRATNEDLADVNQQLTSSNEKLAQYAYVASHDLQEPLRKIRLFSSQLSLIDDLPKDVRETVSRIKGSADRMSMLIKDLLEFSQLLKSDALLRPVKLEAVLDDIREDFALTVAEKGATIVVDTLPVIDGVKLQINQLFYNLVGNALKFSRSGVPPVVRVSSRAATDKEVQNHIERILADTPYYLLSVEDNGIGFEPQFVEQIFDLFKRLHGRAEYTGSGIGLALCRRIVQNHQGKLWAEALPGMGARFFILLPAHQQAHRPAKFADTHTNT